MKSKAKQSKANTAKSSHKSSTGKTRAKLGVTTETERKAPVRIGDIDSGVKVGVDL